MDALYTEIREDGGILPILYVKSKKLADFLDSYGFDPVEWDQQDRSMVFTSGRKAQSFIGKLRNLGFTVGNNHG